MIHIIKKDEEKYLVYVPEKQLLFTCSPLTANILNEYYTVCKSVEDISLDYSLEKSAIIKIIKTLDSIPNVGSDERNKRNSLEIMVNLAHKCNLRCKYCYAQGGSYGLEDSLMNEDIAIKCLEFFNQNYKNYNLNFLFFGGEPLLNFKTLKVMCESYEEIFKNSTNTCHFRIISNGTILNTKIVEFMKKYKIGFTVSIDGPEFIHDRLRKYANGKGSYKAIVNNLKMLKKQYPDCVIFYEATYTTIHEEYGYTPTDIKDFFRTELGLSLGSVVPVMKTNNNIVKYAPIKSIPDPTEYLEKGDLFSSSLFYPLVYFVTKQKSKMVCYTGISHFTIIPNGDIYPCQLFIGENKLLMGNVKQSHWDEKYINAINNLSSFNKEKNPECLQCWCKYLCKDCPGAIFQETGVLKMPNERCYKKRKDIEALLLKLAEIRENNNKWQKFCQMVERYSQEINGIALYD